MPYIPEHEIRAAIIKHIDEVAKIARHKGDLNFSVTRLIHMWIMHKGGPGYQRCSDAMNALTDAAREFYRRILAKYEDIKIRENGEVSPLEEEFNPVKIQRKVGGKPWEWIQRINIHHGPSEFTHIERDAMTFPKTLANRHIEQWPTTAYDGGDQQVIYRIIH